MPTSSRIRLQGWRLPVTGWDILLFSFFEPDAPLRLTTLPMKAHNRYHWQRLWMSRGLLRRIDIDEAQGVDAHWIEACRKVVNEFPRIDELIFRPFQLAFLASLPHTVTGPCRWTTGGEGNSRYYAPMQQLGWISRPSQRTCTLETAPDCIKGLVKRYRELHERHPWQDCNLAMYTPYRWLGPDQSKDLGACIHQHGTEAAWISRKGKFAYYGNRRLNDIDTVLLRGLAELGLGPTERYASGRMPSPGTAFAHSVFDMGDLLSKQVAGWFQFYRLEAWREELIESCDSLFGRNIRRQTAGLKGQQVSRAELAQAGLQWH